jgi:hypothetical protein
VSQNRPKTLSQTSAACEGNRDLYWYLARSWIKLPGIGRVPRFQRVCRAILNHGDEWIRANRNRLDQVINSVQTQLFLVRRGELDWTAVYELSKAKSPKLRREAERWLDNFYVSTEWAREQASMQSFAGRQLMVREILALDQKPPSQHPGARDPREIQALVRLAIEEKLASQPAVVSEPREFKELADLAIKGDYRHIDKWLDRRLAEIKRWWKQKLGVPSHRKAAQSTRFNYLFAHNLKKQGRSWTEVAREVSPVGYNADPKRTIDRIKKGVKGLSKQRSRTNMTTGPTAASAVASDPQRGDIR